MAKPKTVGGQLADIRSREIEKQNNNPYFKIDKDEDKKDVKKEGSFFGGR